MSLRATINGTEVPIFRDSLSVREKIDGRSTGSFNIRTPKDMIPIRAQRGHETIIWDDEVNEDVRISGEEEIVIHEPTFSTLLDVDFDDWTLGPFYSTAGGSSVPVNTGESYHSPGRSMKLRSGSQFGQCSAAADWEPWGLEPVANIEFWIRYTESFPFYYYLEEECMLNGGGGLYGLKGSTGSSTNIMFLGQDTGYTINLGTWYHFKFLVDGINKTLTMWVNDEEIASGPIPLEPDGWPWGETLTGINGIWFSNGQYNGWRTTYIDDVHVDLQDSKFETVYTCKAATVPYRYFGGKVSNVEVNTEADVVIQHVSLTDFGEMADRTILQYINMPPTTLKTLLRTLGDMYLAPIGINYYCIPSEGPAIGDIGYFITPLAKIFKAIKTTSDWLLYFDYYKELRCHPRGYRQAPFNILPTDDPQNFMADTMTVSEDKTNYCNQLYARFQYKEGTETKTGIVLAQDSAEIAARAAAEGGSGLYSLTIDLPEVMGEDADDVTAKAAEAALGQLKSRKVFGQEVSYRTQRRGLRVGQIQHIEQPEMGINGDFIITHISVKFDNWEPTWIVTASTWHVPKEGAAYLENVIESKKNFAPEFSTAFLTEGLEPETNVGAIEMGFANGGPIPNKWDNFGWDFGEWQ